MGVWFKSSQSELPDSNSGNSNPHRFLCLGLSENPSQRWKTAKSSQIMPNSCDWTMENFFFFLHFRRSVVVVQSFIHA